MSAFILLVFLQLAAIALCQKHGDKFQGEQWGSNPKDPYTYDPRLDPKDEKRFDPILWYNEIFSNPERYHNIWRDKHDPYDPYHPYNKYQDVDDRPWRKWPGWDYSKPRPDWYYTRPMIETDRGNIRGYNITVGKIRISQAVYPNEENYLYKMISIFLGIPYALPPVRDWRFKKPMSPNNWFPEELDASRYRNSCAQIDDGLFLSTFAPNLSKIYSEDCLYLNVFAPNLTYNTKKDLYNIDVLKEGLKQRYPVIVFFHGGDFVKSSASIFPGHVLAEKDVVVVTANYRLGPLGFMSTGTRESPGNFGLWDQKKALEWVQDYIELFNGDPSKVTIVGDGAGAISALLHTFHPGSHNLFHQVVAHGGFDTQPGAVSLRKYLYDVEANRPFTPSHHAENLASKIGCIVDINEDDRLNKQFYEEALKRVKDCLKLRAMEEMGVEIETEVDFPPWHPVVDDFVDDPFLPNRIEILAEQGRMKRVPIMAGYERDAGGEALLKDLEVTEEDARDGISKSRFQSMIEVFVQKRNKQYVLFHEDRKEYPDVVHYDRIIAALKYVYTYWPNQDDEMMRLTKVLDMYTDYYYFSPLDATLKLHNQNSPVKAYMYMFDHRSEISSLPEWLGIPKGEAMLYMFGFPFFEKTDPKAVFWDHLRHFDMDRAWTPLDRNISNMTMDFLANFARWGSPTPIIKPEGRPPGYEPYDDFLFNLTWTPFNPGNHYLYINASLHQPFGCSYKYVFDHTIPIGGSNPGAFAGSTSSLGNIQTDYEKTETRLICQEEYDRRQIRLVRENFKQVECGLWQGYYRDLSVMVPVDPTPLPRLNLMTSSVYQGIVYSLVCLIAIVLVSMLFGFFNFRRERKRLEEY